MSSEHKEIRKKILKYTFYYFLTTFIEVFILTFLYVKYNKTEIYLSNENTIIYGIILWGIIGLPFLYLIFKENNKINKNKKVKKNDI